MWFVYEASRVTVTVGGGPAFSLMTQLRAAAPSGSCCPSTVENRAVFAKAGLLVLTLEQKKIVPIKSELLKQENHSV